MGGKPTVVVAFTEFDNFIDVLSSKSSHDDDSITLRLSAGSGCWFGLTRMEKLTSSSNGYPRSMIAFLETSLAGMRVLPLLGNSLLTLLTVPLSLLLEELILSLRTLSARRLL